MGEVSSSATDGRCALVTYYASIVAASAAETTLLAALQEDNAASIVATIAAEVFDLLTAFFGRGITPQDCSLKPPHQKQTPGQDTYRIVIMFRCAAVAPTSERTIFDDLDTWEDEILDSIETLLVEFLGEGIAPINRVIAPLR